MADLSPRRSLAAPFLAVLSVLLWFLNREAGIRAARDAPMDPLVVAALAVAAVAASHAVALAAAPRLPDPVSVPRLLRPVVAPSTATLALVGAASAMTAAYLLLPSVALPGRLETVASVFGFLLGWPLVVLLLVAYGLGAPLPADAQFAVETVAVGLGVALSALWLFVLAGGLVRLAGGDATA